MPSALLVFKLKPVDVKQSESTILKISPPILKVLVVTEHGYPSPLPALLAHVRPPALETFPYTSIDGLEELGPPCSLFPLFDYAPGVKELSLAFFRSKHFSDSNITWLEKSSTLNALGDEKCLFPMLGYFCCSAILHVTILKRFILAIQGYSQSLKQCKMVKFGVSTIPSAYELLELSAGLGV